MPRTGTRRLAQGRDITQYCIDGYLVDEVLDSLPRDVKIIGAKVRIGQSYSKHKKAVPSRLKKLGVWSLHEHKPAKEAILVFDETTKRIIKANVAKACEAIGETTDKAYFMYITLNTGTTTGKFVHTTKDKNPDDSDLRKKVRVLGLEDTDGNARALITALSAKKYTCRVETQTVRTIVCTT